MRLSRLIGRGYDTEAALGNDILTVALQAYGLLKLAARAASLRFTTLSSEGWRRFLPAVSILRHVCVEQIGYQPPTLLKEITNIIAGHDFLCIDGCDLLLNQ